MSGVELLLLSDSFARLEGELEAFVGDSPMLFVPYAVADHDAYLASIQQALAPYGIEAHGVHQATDPAAAARAAEVVFVGGGNSFRLLHALQSLGLVEAIRAAVAGGARYIGSSAGTNMACPSLRTTNDMPIVQPASFEALDLVPFQINPHYIDPLPRMTYRGESRQDRLLEFLEENDVPVLGLREDSWLRVSGDVATLGGHRARLFRRGHRPREVPRGEDLSELLTVTPAFDTPVRRA